MATGYFYGVTRSRSGTWARRVGVCLAMLGLAATTSAPALAESGMPDVPVASVPDLADVATAILEDTSLPELDPASAAGVLPITLPAVPAQTTAAEPVLVGAVAAPPPEPAAEPPVQAAPAVSPAPDAPPALAVTQAEPANVNVSVRVNSPGDDGSVEQANTAAAAPAPRYQPEPPQYQESIPAPDAPPPAPVAQLPASEQAVENSGWDWTWNWNCGDAAPVVPIPAELGVENWTWNWNWNCGADESPSLDNDREKPPQYQPVAAQYRPININVSIRINSPGNNGPVAQTNLAVALTPPTLPQLLVDQPAAVPGQSSGAPSPSPEPIHTLAALVSVFEELVPAEPAEVADESRCCALPEPVDTGAATPDPQSVLLPEAPPAVERDLTPRGRFRAAVAVTITLAEASQAAARRARAAPKPAQLRPAPRQASAPLREQAMALSAAGLAPMNAADSRFGQLVLLAVAFAFAFAFAYASHSVAAEVRVAGEDPDPPPARPG